MSVGLLKAVPDVVWAWGPGIIILVGMYFLLRQFLKGLGQAATKLADTAVNEFLATQKKQAEAMTAQAESMQKLAACVEAQRKETDVVHGPRLSEQD